MLLFSEGEWRRPLSADDYRSIHIREQLGLRRGDTVRVGLMGQGRGRAILLTEPDPSQALILRFPYHLTSVHFHPVHLVIGHPRPPVFARLVRDLSSLGVARMSWIHTTLGEKSYLSSKMWRADLLEKQIRIGLEQGAHTVPPIIRKFYSLRHFMEEEKAAAQASKIVLQPPNDSEKRVQSLNSVLFRGGGTEQRNIIMAIGAERGWTAEEMRIMEDADFTKAHLGASILRTENSALIAAGMAMLSTCGRADGLTASS
ncbi:MAG: RsmE family RNA methyltransferase [Salinispira sp.]